jgi:hypothetical protein
VGTSLLLPAELLRDYLVKRSKLRRGVKVK